MIKKYQVTLFDKSGTYRPVACIVNNQQTNDSDLSIDKQERKKIQKAGVIKICQKRLWTLSDLKKYGYTKYKKRAVDAEN